MIMSNIKLPQGMKEAMDKDLERFDSIVLSKNFIEEKKNTFNIRESVDTVISIEGSDVINGKERSWILDVNPYILESILNCEYEVHEDYIRIIEGDYSIVAKVTGRKWISVSRPLQ